MASYVIGDEVGWVTTVNAAEGLLIGFVWRTTECPWLDIWRRVEAGRPMARGLEFGTTGLHRPFPDLVRNGKIFDRPIVEFLDASESATRSYAGFLAEIPDSYRGVAEIRLHG